MDGQKLYDEVAVTGEAYFDAAGKLVDGGASPENTAAFTQAATDHAAAGEALFSHCTDGQNLSAGAASVSEAYPNVDPEMVRRNTLEINEAAAKARVPKLVRHLMQQRIEEAQYEVKRLQDLLDNSNPALLDCTLDDANKIFG